MQPTEFSMGPAPVANPAPTPVQIPPQLPVNLAIPGIPPAVAGLGNLAAANQDMVKVGWRKFSNVVTIFGIGVATGWYFFSYRPTKKKAASKG